MLPLGAGGVQHGDPSLGVAEQRKGVVFHIGVPIGGGDHALHFHEIAAHQTEEIHHVDALVQQDSAAAGLFHAAPLALIIRAA